MGLDLRETAAFCIQVARFAGAYLCAHYGRVALEWKEDEVPEGVDPATFRAVTEVDRALQRQVASLLLTRFPGIEFYGEERPEDIFDPVRDQALLERVLSNRSPYQFVVDPLDGTHRYGCRDARHGFFIGLLHERQFVLSVTYAPRQDILTHAVRGGGCYRNGRPFRFDSTIDDHVVINSKADKRPRLKEALFAQGAYLIRPKHTGTMYEMLLQEYAAAMVSLLTNTHDHVASLAVEEAGGCVLVHDGKGFRPAAGFDWRCPASKKAAGIPAYIAANSSAQAERLADLVARHG